jgi:DNA-binding NarL/FixJ family response regulator
MLGRSERSRAETILANETFEQLHSVFYGGRAAALLREVNLRMGDPGKYITADGRLTERQLEILRLVARGLSNREIAEALVLSEHTVHRHIGNILQRLDLPSRAAAAVYATNQNLI